MVSVRSETAKKKFEMWWFLSDVATVHKHWKFNVQIAPEK